MIRRLLVAAVALTVSVLTSWLCPAAPAGPEAKPAPPGTAATRRSGIEAARAGRWQEARAALNDSYLRTQAVEHLTEFEGDIARANDEQRLRRGGEGQGAGACQVASLG